jgi:dual specificity tyrosine-phosphorylation-regulated kinase 2/3/4
LASPAPPLPDPPHPSKTPETRPVTLDPVTPHRDPSKIDRRVLHGLGELATPRWTRSVANREDDSYALDQDELEPPLHEEPEEGDSDSPWTIEAIDGEEDEERDEVRLSPFAFSPSGSDCSIYQPSEVTSIPRTIRTRPSVTEESGGEEILYPRTHFSKPSAHSANYSPSPTTVVPPSAFSPLMNRARKRTSDEFERDQTGTLVKKHQRSPSGSILDGTMEERVSARKHRSLGVGIPSRDKPPRDRRKDSISTGGNQVRERHSRHTSASSSSSSHGEQLHSRRVHTTDFSHLPPSPSTTSIQQILRHAGSNSAISTSSFNLHKDAQNHHAPNVAHSLLRGTQEGWSDLDDHATAEALRKLDGLSGKSGTRVRSSVGSLRPVSSSRPGTPAKSTPQWEGVGSDSGKTSRRSSMHLRDSNSLTKDKDQTPSASRQVVGLVESVDISEQGGSVFGSSDETQLSSPAQEKPPTKKSSASARLSYTTKRGSTSSTTYTSTPTTSSRDSGSMSAGTSLTSISAQSGRHSTSKARRNSVGSDASQSGDVTFLKDRAASLASSVEQQEAGQDVPPVPPLPKDLSTYRSPPQSSTGPSFPTEGVPIEESTQADNVEPSLSAPSEVAAVLNVSKPSTPPPYSSHSDSQVHAPAPAATKTPSKKWSLLGMRLSGSPSVTVPKDNSSAKAPHIRNSPHSAAPSQPNRRSISKDASEWVPIQQPDAMTSAASLVSQSSISALSVSGAVVGTPDRQFPSRPDTASSSHKSSSLAAPQQTPLSPSGSIRRGSSKRLTPSAIPFFRRSSSQSVQVNVLRSSSPPASTGPSYLQPREPVSPVDSSLSTPPGAHKKSSIISLGSLLKGSSSRRNLQAGKDEPRSDRESRRARDTDGGKSDKERVKKEEKDRSESRISALMGRKRGKVTLVYYMAECCPNLLSL